MKWADIVARSIILVMVLGVIGVYCSGIYHIWFE